MFVLALLLAAACTPTTTVIGGGEGGKDGAGTGETDTGANEDSGGNDDSGDTGEDTDTEDTEPSPATFAGEYRGENAGRWESGRWEAECEGEVRFDVSEEGAVDGLATCVFEEDGEAWELEGELTGEVDEDGLLTLIWTLDMGREEAEVEGAGKIVDGEATVELYADFGREGEYVGEMNAQRR